MEQQLIHPKSGEIIKILENVNCLKDILLYCKDNSNHKVIVKVTDSRYIKILADYWSLNSIFIDDGFNMYLRYKYYFLQDSEEEIIKAKKSKDKKLIFNGNVFKVLRTGKKEEKKKCKDCNCGNKRYINGETGLCYYKEMLNNNYITKLK